MFPRTYRPTPKIVQAPRASKISTYECINTGLSSTFMDALFLLQMGKCENSAQKWPDYVKSTLKTTPVQI